MKIPLNEFDVIFISYDEPNADKNWLDLQSKCPWAKRSHGIYGSDSSHKAAAMLSETSRFITIDADNIINPEIFNQEFDESVIKSNRVLSFKGQNVVNELVYGNGGIKCWTVQEALNMKTHENSNSEAGKIEFCWSINYLQIDKVFSKVYNNASPYQAFRAGFREGCKMSLNQGIKIPKETFLDEIYPMNFKRLKTWMSIGSDVENGYWCIYGARLGFYMTNMTKWDFVNVRDFKYLNRLWEDISKQFTGNEKICAYTNYSYSEEALIKEINNLGNKIQQEYPFSVPLFSAKDSEFIKQLV